MSGWPRVLALLEQAVAGAEYDFNRDAFVVKQEAWVALIQAVREESAVEPPDA